MKIIRISFIAAILAISIAGSVHAKSYRFERFYSDVEVFTDGSVRVTETITYRFDGRYTWAWRTIPLRPGVDVSELGVSENETTYRSEGSERPGTFHVARTVEGLRVRWFYRAEDETRTFQFSYRMTGAVTRHPDVVEYYHKLIGGDSDQRIENVGARVSLPLPGRYASDVRAWAHGPLHGTVTVESAERVTAEVAPLPVGRFFELRILMPAGPFQSMPVAPGGPALDRILAEEARWADQANRERQRRVAAYQRYAEKRALQEKRTRQWFPIAWVLAAVSVLVWVNLFLRHGRPHPVVAHVAPGSIPSGHPPAVVAQLMTSGVGGPALVATLLDLAERRYLTVEETSEMKRGWFGRQTKKTDFVFRSTGENPGELQTFEAELLAFLFNEVGDGREFTMKGIEQTARKRRNEFRRWFQKWMKGVRKLALEEKLIEPYATRAMVLNGVCGVAVLGIGAGMSIVTQSYAGVPAIAAGFLQTIFTAALHRRTPEGRRLYLEWKGFRRYLRMTSRGMGELHVGRDDWGRYVAIAIVFGMHKELIPRLHVDAAATGAYMPAWYLYGAGGGEGISGLAGGLTSMIDSVSTTMSSASGAGGGASGGGGGGAGGGGAGAG